MTVSTLHVRVPMLERAAAGRGGLPSSLRTLLARGRFTAGPADRSLACVLGVPALPAAGPLSRQGSRAHHETATGGFWLRADLVRMIPDLAAVWVGGPLEADLVADALAPLRREFDRMFAAEAMEWVPEPGTAHAVVRADAAPACRFVERDIARGRRLDEVLPSGEDARRWRRLINESQMILHQFRALDRSDQQGAGLWFWGGGTMPAPVPAAIAGGSRWALYAPADDVLVRGLARWLGVAYEPARRFDAEGGPRRLLWWRPDAADTSFEALERDWLAPAHAALMRGRLGEITVIGDGGTWRFARWSALARWRRNDRFVSRIQDPVQADG